MFELLLASALVAAPTPSEPVGRPVARAGWVDERTFVLDGDPSEWRGEEPPGIVIDRLDQIVELGGRPRDQDWSGPEDASLVMWVGWNATDLILGGEVRDDVDDHDAGRWFHGDSLELFLNLADRTPEWGPDDYQLMLAPNWGQRPWGVYPRGDQDPGLLASDGGFGGIEVASVPLEGGYRFEARIPWSNFGTYQAAAGDVLPFNFALCDRDATAPGRAGGPDNYATWSGDSDIARFADRRGDLVLVGGAAQLGARAEEGAGEDGLGARRLLLILLACTYALALFTRGVWQQPRRRRLGLALAAVVLVVSSIIAVWARHSQVSEADSQRLEVEQYWSQFEALLDSGALGNPEPAVLVADASALLSGGAITPVSSQSFDHLAPADHVPGERGKTLRRGIPFRVITPVTEGPEEQAGGVVLGPGQMCVLPVEDGLSVDAVHLVVEVTDRRFFDVTGELPVLSVDLMHAGTALSGSSEIRHKRDVHHQEDDHEDHPGLEPAQVSVGGRVGKLHSDALLLLLNSPAQIDQVVVRHAPGVGYDIRLLAVGVRRWREAIEVPAGLRPTASGEWAWSDWRPEIDADVFLAGRAAPLRGPRQVVRDLALGDEAVGRVRLFDTTPQPSVARWELLPAATLAFLAPFLVTLFAEWLARRRRIRGKLAVGFVVTSAVPMLALTLLLDASLGKEREVNAHEWAASALNRASQDLQREERALEREAVKLLRMAELRHALEGRFPASAAELDEWWGDGAGLVRLLEHSREDGRRRRVGSGPGWRELPMDVSLRAGLQRPWGRLLICGVAHTASGADEPLTVFVARPPPATTPDGVRLLGAGRDPAVQYADLTPRSSTELRRPLFGPTGDELMGVFVVPRRERESAMLWHYSLTELLLAAGITAAFTALLFAGILTGHIVGPIERLARAVREGSTASVETGTRDEIGHLTSAIRTSTAEAGQRMAQLEALRVAHEDLSQKLDFDQARAAVLAFFQEQARAESVWLAWGGAQGEQPRLHDERGRNLPVPEDSKLLQRALVETDAFEVAASADRPWGESERLLFGDPARVLSLPLLAAGDCRGAILLGLAAAEAPGDLAFLRAAAGQAAIVLENARLYHEAVTDAVTGFLSEPGFRQRLTEEIQRAEGSEHAGVLLVRLRLGELPEADDEAAVLLREAARRVRLAVRGLAVFGRAGTADLVVAIPWTEREPDAEAVERGIAERVSLGPWPNGDPVSGLLTSRAAWPADGPSARFVVHLLEERLVEVRSSEPRRAKPGELPADFVVESPIMVELLDILRRMAQREVTVLIVGETGVGKDRLAELVHAWSPRRAGPVVNIHCPSLSDSLIEDELFGHEEGAFTGAHARRIGPFEEARGGTVVLDEVGGLSPEGQVALLRLLETREVLPVGSSRPVPIDVRFVATTTKNLVLEVDRGTFRRDLYFRLNVSQITVPPLRMRREELPRLVDGLVGTFNQTAQQPVGAVEAAAMDLLFDHDWPGNLRELENVIVRGLILAAGADLAVEHLDLEGTPELPAEEGGPPLNSRQEALLEALPHGARVSSAEHGGRAGVSSRTALRDLLELSERGFLVREGQKRGTRFRRTEKALRRFPGQVWQESGG